MNEKKRKNEWINTQLLNKLKQSQHQFSNTIEPAS